MVGKPSVQNGSTGIEKNVVGTSMGKNRVIEGRQRIRSTITNRGVTTGFLGHLGQGGDGRIKEKSSPRADQVVGEPL